MAKIPHVFLILLLLFCGLMAVSLITNHRKITGAPPFPVEPGEDSQAVGQTFQNWNRPEGPPRVGLQVGHWQNDQVPEELSNLRGNTGASGGGKAEWEVNMAIAEAIKDLLQQRGVAVDILPTTVPPRYWADVFVAIHADGNTDSSVNGFKFARGWRDVTSKAESLVALLETSYSQTTGMAQDPNISRNMRGYYAFAWWRFEHAVHPMTTAVIAETGFLTNPSDRTIIVDNHKLSAQGIAEGILNFLTEEKLLSQ